MCFKKLSVLWLSAVLVAMVAAQEPLNTPPPLVAPTAGGVSPGENVLTFAAAERAQEMGFPSASIALYRRLLAAADSKGGPMAGGDRESVTLGLASALLDEGQGLEAEHVLVTLAAPRGAAWHLRKGLAAAQQHETTTAKNERDASRFSELSPADRGWHLFLQGMIATAEGEHDKAAILFTQATDAAVSEQARARFLLKRDEARLRSGQPPTEVDADRARKNLEQFQGRKVGYGFARTYAVILNGLGRKSEAVKVLKQHVVSLPAEERGEIDEMRLLLGLIAGAEGGEGRNALERLLERGSDRDKQRIALQLLAKASMRNPQLADFRTELDGLIAAAPAHPILEDILLFRAHVALTTARLEKTSEGYARAEDDARTLLQKFPGSPLKAHAYGVLTDSAWEQRRYRTAADNAVKARAELPAGPARVALGVLIAEAWFRARDFRSAADAYAHVLREPMAEGDKSKLMFQRVLAEIEASAPETATTVLDEFARDPAFDVENRWQAEWNLARALQVRGKTVEALARVNRLLAGAGTEVAVLPAELRARMAWLQARLSSTAGQHEKTLALVDGIMGSLAGIAPELKNEIASSVALLRAEANFALGHSDVALENLKRLRVDFPRSEAAVYSFFDEAEYYARQDKTVEAQQLLTKLADDFPENKTYAPLALFKAALQAERRGQDANLKEANQYIEDLVTRYPDSPLVFAARLKQGDLWRRLNQFPQAQQAYEELVNKFPQRRDIALAQLALASTHNAQSMNEPAHAESALVLFEHVRDRVDAPLDARVEAGFNIGMIHAKRGETAKAEEVWWGNVVYEFLLKPELAAQLGDKGRHWMTRTLLELGALYEQQEKLEQAKESWLLILKYKLDGETLAKARLAKFNLAEIKQ